MSKSEEFTIDGATRISFQTKAEMLHKLKVTRHELNNLRDSIPVDEVYRVEDLITIDTKELDWVTLRMKNNVFTAHLDAYEPRKAKDFIEFGSLKNLSNHMHYYSLLILTEAIDEIKKCNNDSCKLVLRSYSFKHLC